MAERQGIEDAVKNGNIDDVKFHFERCDKELKTGFCERYAWLAAEKGQVEVVKFLVQTVADQNVRDRCCVKAAKLAASEGHLEVVKFLVQTVADQNLRDRCCVKAAKLAASEGHLQVVKFLVQTVADQTVRDRCCVEAAKQAVEDGHLEVVKFLVQTVADQTVRDRCCVKAAKPAASEGQLKVVKFLVQTVADQTVRDRCCVEAAKHAASEGHLKVVKFLVQTAADQSVRDRCCIEAAKRAAYSGHSEVVKFLVQTVADQNVRDQLRFEAAVSACSGHQDDVVAFLTIEPDWLFKSSEILSYTASMAIEGRNSALSQTLSRMQPAQITQLLCLSISQGHVALALSLLSTDQISTEHVDKSDSTGATALMLAADAGHHELIEKLLGLGASVRAEDSQGRTALSRAVEAGHVRAAKTLIDGGADANHRDGRGETCAQLAERLGRSHSQVLRLLRDSEASSPQAGQPAAHRSHPGLPLAPDDPQRDRQLSEDLHRLLSEAGFTVERVKCQQRLADWLEGVARVLTRDDRQMTGSYAEGWANSLVQVNGRTAADSDIDWTVLVAGQELHLEGGCHCPNVTRLQVTQGHAQVPVGSGLQPVVTAKACGVRPSQDTCHAIPCCDSFCEDRVKKLNQWPGLSEEVHLVMFTRPNSTNELRVSFSFQEKRIMRQLSTVQGQLFAVIKFIFKRLLPHTLDTHGLKTYNAKTLLFFMLEKHGNDPSAEAWQPQNLIALLKESLDMMLRFIDSTSSPDECMPHFFMPDAPLYFKNAGIGGDFDNTKARVRQRLGELRINICFVVEQLKRLVRPLQSESFYFHPFTLLPLTALPSVTEIREEEEEKEEDNYEAFYYKFADVYSVVHQCVSELQSESSNRDTLMRQLSLLHELEWCKCATLCLTAMAHLKFKESEEAERVLMELQGHRVSMGFQPGEIQEEYSIIQLPNDWAWRFCLPCDSPPRFPFLPEFTQTLFTARLSQPRSSHLYVSFRCLSWSLQAELLRNRTPITFGVWLEELQEDADLEELLTLAHYSDCREHVELSLRLMETIRDERRVAMETQDEEKISWVREKL